MRVIDLKSNKEIILSDDMRLSCAIGNFDGVHIGHQELLKEAAKKEYGCTHSAVFTFLLNTHLHNESRPAYQLTNEEQKNRLLLQRNIDIAIYEDFDNIKDLSPEVFAKNTLMKQCNVVNAICGLDFRFGSHASGNASLLSKLFTEEGYHSSVIDIKEVDGMKVSSTDIRNCIENGKMEEANRLLGRPYSIYLQVESGNKIGRTMGFPTINQVFPKYHVIPRYGVYASKTIVDGKEYVSISNVGIKPTIQESEKHVNCETNILNFNGDLYGRTIEVFLYSFIRSERQFDSIDSLIDQIGQDKKTIISYFNDGALL